MTVMGKNKAESSCRTRWHQSLRAMSLLLVAMVVCCSLTVSAHAAVLINGISQSDYLYSLRNDATYNVISSGLSDNVYVDYNSSQKNKPWRGMLFIDGTTVPNRNPAGFGLQEYTTRISLITDFYLGGLIKTNTRSVLEIQTENTTPPVNNPRWFTITSSGRMYLAGGAVVNNVNESSLTVVNANWKTDTGSSLMFGFNNGSESFNDTSVVATKDWSDTTKVNVAQIVINGEAKFNGNIGIVSSQRTLWQTPNGTSYKAGSIVVNGAMTTRNIGIATSSLFYRPEISVYNSDNLSGGNTPNTIRVYAVVSGFGGLNQNLQSLAEYGYNVTYLNDNQMEVARNLDRARASIPAVGSPIASVIKPMWEYGDDNGESGRELGHAEQQERIARLGHLFQQLSGDTHANAMYLGLNRPWAVPLANLNLGAQMVFTGDPEKPVGNLNRLWVTPQYTGTTLAADGNAREGGVSRVGFQMGADRRIAQNASVGLALGYHRAYLHQENDRVQFGDFQLGAYGGAMFGNYFEVRSYLGFGVQSYDSTRIVDIASLRTGDRSQTAFGKADGYGIYFTTEFARPIFAGPIIIRPTMAIDSETAIRKEFTETGDDISLRVDRSTYSRTRLRFGSSFETNPQPTSRFTLNSRVFYAVQLDGKDHAAVNSQFNSVYADPGQVARSIKTGIHYIDAGGGMKAYLNRARTLSGLLQYDGSFSEYTFTNTVALGTMFVF